MSNSNTNASELTLNEIKNYRIYNILVEVV